MKLIEVPSTYFLHKNRKTDPHKHSILIIDDNIDLLELQKMVLEMEGFDVSTAQSGAQAMSVLTEIPEPDLILLDMQMQDMTGSDFLLMLEEKIPKIIQNVPVVFHTAMEKVSISKAVGFINKTGGVNNFLEAIRHFVKMRPRYSH